MYIMYILRKFQGRLHCPKLFAGSREKDINFIAMQLVGESLARLRRNCPIEPGRFSMGTTIRLVVQCLEAIRVFHYVGVLYPDIKPGNFGMVHESTSAKSIIHLYDFGLARLFVYEKGNIRKQRPVVGFRGTMRYCSMNTHLQDLGRKDDLTSLYYMITEFNKGLFPWRSALTPQDVQASKLENPIETLLATQAQFQTVALHLNRLGFEDKLNYQLLIDNLISIYKEKAIPSNQSWDWDDDFSVVITENVPVPK